MLMYKDAVGGRNATPIVAAPVKPPVTDPSRQNPGNSSTNAIPPTDSEAYKEWQHELGTELPLGLYKKPPEK